MEWKTYIPFTQEESAEGGEKQAGTQTRMNIVDSLQAMFQLIRQGLVEIPESPHTRRVVVPLYCGVEVNNDVRTWLQLMMQLL